MSSERESAQFEQLTIAGRSNFPVVNYRGEIIGVGNYLRRRGWLWRHVFTKWTCFMIIYGDFGFVKSVLTTKVRMD